MRPVSWQELRKVALRLGFIDSRQRGSHVMMVRAGTARPVVIPKQRELRPDVLHSNLRTMGIDREELLRLLDEI